MADQADIAEVMLEQALQEGAAADDAAAVERGPEAADGQARGARHHAPAAPDAGDFGELDPSERPIPSVPAYLHPAMCSVPPALQPDGSAGDSSAGGAGAGAGIHRFEEETVAERVGQARLPMREGDDGVPHFPGTARHNHMAG
jgi:hypothetical protein